jgi:hypothetical protein
VVVPLAKVIDGGSQTMSEHTVFDLLAGCYLVSRDHLLFRAEISVEDHHKIELISIGLEMNKLCGYSLLVVREVVVHGDCLVVAQLVDLLHQLGRRRR